jgi:hypothetical protein
MGGLINWLGVRKWSAGLRFDSYVNVLQVNTGEYPLVESSYFQMCARFVIFVIEIWKCYYFVDQFWREATSCFSPEVAEWLKATA